MPLPFLIISSSPSPKNVAQNFKPLVLAESPSFHGLWYTHLRFILSYSNWAHLSGKQMKLLEHFMSLVLDMRDALVERTSKCADQVQMNKL